MRLRGGLPYLSGHRTSAPERGRAPGHPGARRAQPRPPALSGGRRMEREEGRPVQGLLRAASARRVPLKFTSSVCAPRGRTRAARATAASPTATTGGRASLRLFWCCLREEKVPRAPRTRNRRHDLLPPASSFSDTVPSLKVSATEEPAGPGLSPLLQVRRGRSSPHDLLILGGGPGSATPVPGVTPRRFKGTLRRLGACLRGCSGKQRRGEPGAEAAPGPLSPRPRQRLPRRPNGGKAGAEMFL